MDFETLQEILPKKSQIWSSEDIAKWLEFINLSNLISIFRDTGIDGSCIHLLDDETLKTQLNITSPIIRKKLMNWVGFGLNGYDNYLTQNTKMLSTLLPKNLELKKSQTTHIRKQSRPKMSNHEQSRSSQQHLILQQFEGNSLGFHIIKNQPMSIGFGKSNQIHSLQTSISQRHALIGRKNNKFFIQDLGSRYGTYIKINHRTLLRNNMILQIGSYQFVVIDINQNNKTLKLKQIYLNIDLQSNQQNNKNLSNIDQNKNKKSNKTSDTSIINIGINKNQNSAMIPQKPLQILQIDLKIKQKYTFGRRKQNDFQRQDKHMSGMHCKITFFNNSFYIQDYGSTNGTWHRLSPQYMTSIQYPIENQMYIKLGTAITYICRINNSNENDIKNKVNKITNKLKDDNQMIDQNLCKICGKLQNNCLFLPCSHNICCIECSIQIDMCTECGHTIGDKLKIHK